LELSLKSKEKIQVIIREWKDIKISHEFRGFVFNKKLTGLSQYFDICYFENINKNKIEILDRIQKFYDKISDSLEKMNLSNFIIDFAITDDDKVLIIELNPWSTNTDASLFSWNQNMNQLMNGPFEFRIRENQMKNLKNIIISSWSNYF
jgi:hypothetical protein